MIGGDGVRLGVAMRGDVPCVVLFCAVFHFGWRVVASRFSCVSILSSLAS